MEEELKKDHSDMQAVVDSKQKIIDAQVRRRLPLALMPVACVTKRELHLCVCVCVGEAHRLAGRGQRPPDERPGAAEGALQPADPQRHLPHQPHQAADHRKRRVQEQQQLLGPRPRVGRGGGGWGRVALVGPKRGWREQAGRSPDRGRASWDG